MKKYFLKNKNAVILSVVSLCIMWAVWIIAYYAVGNDYIIPSFKDTFLSFFKCLTEGEFWIAFAFTLLRTLGSFLISFLLAAACCALSSLSKIFKGLLNPLIVILRTLPTLAVILILLIWTNVTVAPIIVTILLLFPVTYSQFLAAVEGIDTDVLEMAKMYNVSKRDRLLKIYLPMSAPAVFSQIGANVSLGLKVMISAEVLSNTYKSLGGMMQNARVFLEMPRLAALTLVAVFSGLLLEFAFAQFKRINSKWRKTPDDID